MADIWETKSIKPMLIGTEGQPFDSEKYIYELKLDGERCIAYLDIDKTILKNKRSMLMLPKVPELKTSMKMSMSAVFWTENLLLSRTANRIFLIYRNAV